MSRFIYYTLVFPILAIIFIFSSCISSEETNYLQHLPKDYQMVAFEEYKLAVRDNIACKITTADEETQQLFNSIIADNPASRSGLGLVIYEDNTVIIPFFGAVEIAGLTVQQAELKIQDLMMQSILDAQVKITLISNVFYIYADDRQGSYNVYKENMTIYQALAVSGQTTERMDLSNVKIVRKGADGLDMIKQFDLRSQDIIQSEFYYVKPNDVIYFSTNKNSFFNITSVSSFVTLIMTPLMFLFFTLDLKK